MAEYLENIESEFGQVFAEFATFLYLVRIDSKNDKMLHNVLLDCKRIHIRALCDFFSNSKKPKYEDDLIYKDMLSDTEEIDLSVSMDSTLRTLINKSTAHLTRSRGKVDNPPAETYVQMCKELIQRIGDFTEELRKGNISSDYSNQLEDQDVKDLRQSVYTQLLEIALTDLQGEVTE